MNAETASSGSSVQQTDQDCCKSTVSGGLNNFTALLEKYSKTEHQKPTVPSLHLESPACPALPASQDGIYTQHPQVASPPSLGKYVLYGSLLI